MCILIDGKSLAEKLSISLRHEIEIFKKNYFEPCLSVILIGDNPASKIYVSKKIKACEFLGIKSQLHNEIVTQNQLIEKLNNLNTSKDINGILIQLPIPTNFDLYKIFDSISPFKDVDVFNPYNVGLLVQERQIFNPCTPRAIQQILRHGDVQISGKHVVVINRSNVVGKPLSSMLIQNNNEFANATVTVCHDRTPPDLLKSLTKQADIIVVAVGIPHFLKAEMISKHSVIVDVGVSRVNDKIIGDVDPSCYEIASKATKSIGGVGPLTVHYLMENTFLAAKLSVGLHK